MTLSGKAIRKETTSGCTLVVLATQKELQAVFHGFDEVPLLVEGEPERVKMDGRNYMFLLCGVGPLNAALNLGLALGRLEAKGMMPQGVLNLGIAGTFDREALPIGGIVIAESEIWPEYGLRTARGVSSRSLKYPLATTPEGPVWNSIDLHPEKNLLLLGLEVKKDIPSVVRNGVGVTVAGVSATPERAWQLRTGCSALFENMEGFALALTALKAKLPFVEIRSVSNQAGSRNPDQWNVPLALERLGQVSTSLLMQQAIR